MNNRVLTVPILMLTAFASAADWYLSPTGNDRATGRTPKEAFRSPQVAVDRAQPGDRVLFLSGEYRALPGATMLTITRSGESGKPIVLMAAPKAKPILRIEGGWEGIKVVGASHLMVRGLTLVGSAGAVTLKEAQAEMSNLSNPRTSGNGLTITGDAKAGTIAHHITVQDCEIRDFPGGGLQALRADYITFERNTVSRCGFWSPYANSGISVYQPADIDDKIGYKIIIRNNVSFQNRNYIPFYYSNAENPAKRQITDGNGIILDDFARSQTFGGGNGDPYLGATLVANNVVMGNGGSGIHVYLSHNVDIVHNAAINNNQTETARDGQIFANTSHHVRVLNNIMVAPADKPVNSDYQNGEGVVYDGNLYARVDGSTPTYARERANNLLGACPYNLAQWVRGVRKIKYRPGADLVRKGVETPVETRDFFGRKRRLTGADIGPFQISK